jgi:hypothetical protein
MNTRGEAVHFRKSSSPDRKECLVRPVEKQRAKRTPWKVFTSEQDYQSYVTTGKHRHR